MNLPGKLRGHEEVVTFDKQVMEIVPSGRGGFENFPREVLGRWKTNS